MQRSSQTIGAIAAALAKAQGEIANPEKALVATIRSPHPRESDRTFRYAALSAGLDIVRKCLGRQAIAIVQTTAMDVETGWIRLTTVLAHASGEWLSSEWPVCSLSEAGAPRRMGAALTYARRYALFTLVGIAGEDDLDAPDLEGSVSPGAAPPSPWLDDFRSVDRHGRNGDGADVAAEARGRRRAPPPPRPHLPPDQSALQRDRLLGELADLAKGEDATAWAQLSLPAKNRLTIDDARIVEARFREKLEALEGSPPEKKRRAKAGSVEALDRGALGRADQEAPPVKPEAPAPLKEPFTGRRTPSGSGAIPQRPIIAKTLRLRDKEHRKFVASQPCLVCGRTPADPHHLRFAQPRALGRKVSDEFTVPVLTLTKRRPCCGSPSAGAKRIWAALRLYRLRGPSVWRELLFSAFEDIGLGALDALLKTAAIAADGKIRANPEAGEPELGALGRRLAEAPKDRSASSLLSAAWSHPAFEDARRLAQ